MGAPGMERFVVGTGRCGSTLLSRMLGKAPEVVSLFEFFNGLDMSERFSPGPISGKVLAELISREQPFVTAVLRRGYPVEEITYPFADEATGGRGRGKHRRGDPLPWILVSTLPRLTDEPDALLEKVCQFAATLPEQPPRDHYLALFAWLGEEFGRSTWIERSGSSIDYAADLIRLYPNARFVHLHRAGAEVALSMREHHAYRLPISLLYDAPLASGQRVSEAPPLDLHSPPEPGDTISQILASRPPAEYFGRYWADQILRGKPSLDALSPGRVLEIAFEDLVSRPEQTLAEVAQFLELDTARAGKSWIPIASRLVRGIPPLRAPGLDEREHESLLAACAPANRLLAHP